MKSESEDQSETTNAEKGAVDERRCAFAPSAPVVFAGRAGTAAAQHPSLQRELSLSRREWWWRGGGGGGRGWIGGVSNAVNEEASGGVRKERPSPRERIVGDGGVSRS